MPKKIINLPHHQSISFTNKILWESARTLSELYGLTISEFVQIATEMLISSKDRESIISRYKLFKELNK